MKPETTDPETGTRERLLQSAIREFSRSGFEGATVRDICAQARANLNAVKYHFGDKQALYLEAVQTAHRAIHAAPEGPPAELIEDRPGDPAARLQAFVGRMVAMAMAAEGGSDVHHQLMLRELMEPTAATEQLVREFIAPVHGQLGRILAELLPTDLDPTTLRMLTLSVVGQCLHYRFAASVLEKLLPESERQQMTVERVAGHITRVTLAAAAAYRDAP